MATNAISIPSPDGMPYDQVTPEIMEKALIDGDLSKLTPQHRLAYVAALCKQTGLNPMTRPFDFIKDDGGKLRIYIRKDAAEQLRKLHRISTRVVSRELVDDMYVVTVSATLPDGFGDESIGVVSLGQLQGQARANAMMKCESKAKRRVTLSICGLGIEDGPDHEPRQPSGVVDLQTGELREGRAPTPILAPPHEDATAQQVAQQRVLTEIRALYSTVVKPLKHAGLAGAIADQCFKQPWSGLGQASFAELDRGLPLLRVLCARLVEKGLPEGPVDAWIRGIVQELAAKATSDLFDGLGAEAHEEDDLRQTSLLVELSPEERAAHLAVDATLAEED